MKYKGIVNFSTLDTMRFGYHAHELGVDLSRLPAFTIQNILGDQVLHFNQDSKITVDAIEKFIEDFLDEFPQVLEGSQSGTHKSQLKVPKPLSSFFSVLYRFLIAGVLSTSYQSLKFVRNRLTCCAESRTQRAVITPAHPKSTKAKNEKARIQPYLSFSHCGLARQWFLRRLIKHARNLVLSEDF
jgi:hypothetical protein